MNLFPVNVDILYDGMVVDTGIYYYSKDNLVLLCKDTVLTESMIRSIKATVSYGHNIYLEKASRDKLLRETSYFEKAQLQVEQMVGYDTLKDITKDFIRKAYDDGVISTATIDNIVTQMQEKLHTYDDALILQCINGIRAMDEYLYSHSLNVGIINGLMAKWCSFPHDKIYRFIKAGFVHDLGKLKISPEILNKPARLTPLEYESIKRHPEFGYSMLLASGETDDMVLDAVIHHHERVNGAGYPEGLGLGSISTGARITAISDVYDAMVAERPYKGASTPFLVLQELSDTSFSDLDLNYVNILLDNMAEELTGRMVLLSDGSIARTEHIDPRQPKYPIVSIDGEKIKTDESLFCVKIYAEA